MWTGRGDEPTEPGGGCAPALTPHGPESNESELLLEHHPLDHEGQVGSSDRGDMAPDREQPAVVVGIGEALTVDDFWRRVASEYIAVLRPELDQAA
jgi:hypothetical protein